MTPAKQLGTSREHRATRANRANKASPALSALNSLPTLGGIPASLTIRSSPQAQLGDLLLELWNDQILPRLKPQTGEQPAALLERALAVVLPKGGMESFKISSHAGELRVGVVVRTGLQIYAHPWYTRMKQQHDLLPASLVRRLQRAARFATWSGFEAFEQLEATRFAGEDDEDELLGRIRREYGEELSENEVQQIYRDEYGGDTFDCCRARLGEDFCGLPLLEATELEQHCPPGNEAFELLSVIKALETLPRLPLATDGAGTAAQFVIITEMPTESEELWTLESYDELHNYFQETGEDPEWVSTPLSSTFVKSWLTILRFERLLWEQVVDLLEKQE